MPHFRRTHLQNGTEDHVTIVRCQPATAADWLQEPSSYAVQITQGERIVGLFALDGTPLLSAQQCRAVQLEDCPLTILDRVVTQWETEGYEMELLFSEGGRNR